MVKGLDAYDRTLVLDIKPYDKWDTSITDRVPEWLAKIDQWHWIPDTIYLEMNCISR